MRIDEHAAAPHTARMDKDTREDLMDEAERLALQVFGEAAEREHIEAVFERLALHWRWGLSTASVATVH